MRSSMMKNSPILNLFKKCTTSGNYILPVPETLMMRKVYDISEPNFSRMLYSDKVKLSRQEIQEALNSNSIEFSYDVRNWQKEIGFCDMEFQQEHFVIKKHF